LPLRSRRGAPRLRPYLNPCRRPLRPPQVREVAQEAIARARRGDGPTLIEAETYRFRGHSLADPDELRSKEEKAKYAVSPQGQFRDIGCFLGWGAVGQPWVGRPPRTAGVPLVECGWLWRRDGYEGCRPCLCWVSVVLGRGGGGWRGVQARGALSLRHLRALQWPRLRDPHCESAQAVMAGCCASKGNSKRCNRCST
jgi:hypothetical protein